MFHDSEGFNGHYWNDEMMDVNDEGWGKGYRKHSGPRYNISDAPKYFRRFKFDERVRSTEKATLYLTTIGYLHLKSSKIIKDFFSLITDNYLNYRIYLWVPNKLIREKSEPIFVINFKTYTFIHEDIGIEIMTKTLEEAIIQGKVLPPTIKENYE